MVYLSGYSVSSGNISVKVGAGGTVRANDV